MTTNERMQAEAICEAMRGYAAEIADIHKRLRQDEALIGGEVCENTLGGLAQMMFALLNATNVAIASIEVAAGLNTSGEKDEVR